MNITLCIMKQAILGTMNWGKSAQVKKEEVVEMIRYFAKFCEEAGMECVLDTARIYQHGETEELVGEILQDNPELGAVVKIHTKASPYLSQLDEQGVTEQLEASLRALKLDCVDVFYLHQPDMKTNVEETLRACDKLYRLGKFKQLGLSNFASWDLVRCYHICKAQNYVLPTVYQGCYNALSRTMEGELFPAAKTFNVRVVVFNPLGAGLLTGRYSTLEDITKASSGRFSPEFDFIPAGKEHPFKGKGHLFYVQRYGNEEHFQAVSLLREACEKDTIEMTAASFRWLNHHSLLSRGDGVIFGASKLSHLQENCQAFLEKGLPQSLTKAFDDARNITHAVCENYAKGYGSRPGESDLYMANIESLSCRF